MKKMSDRQSTEQYREGQAKHLPAHKEREEVAIEPFFDSVTEDEGQGQRRSG